MRFFKAKRELDATCLGNMLVDQEVITRKELDAALKKQEDRPELLLGEALIEMHVLTATQLEVWLSKQNVIRNDAKSGVSRLADATTKQIQEVSSRTDALLQRLDAKKVASG